MLVVTRRVGETLIIKSGEHTIEITVLSARGQQVRIGTQAPQEVKIVRKEIDLRESHTYDHAS